MSDIQINLERLSQAFEDMFLCPRPLLYVMNLMIDSNPEIGSLRRTFFLDLPREPFMAGMSAETIVWISPS